VEQSTEETYNQIFIKLQRVASLYGSGIPLKMLHDASKEQKVVPVASLLFISITMGECSHPDAERLLHAAVEKGLKRDLATVLWLDEEGVVSQYGRGGDSSLQTGIQVVLCGEAVERERFRRVHQSLLPMNIIETVSLLQAANVQGKKRELWRDLQPLIIKS
jgi:hypothetical protein